eukprot:3650875-Pleurochrysis_carterae.AAC.1
MSLVGGADFNGTASGDSTDLRFDRPYWASPTGLFETFAQLDARAALPTHAAVAYPAGWPKPPP